MHYKQKITPFFNKSLLLSLGCFFTFNLIVAQEEVVEKADSLKVVSEVVKDTISAPQAAQENLKVASEVIKDTISTAQVAQENLKEVSEVVKDTIPTPQAVPENLKVASEVVKDSVSTARVAQENLKVTSEVAKDSVSTSQIAPENLKLASEVAKDLVSTLQATPEKLVVKDTTNTKEVKKTMRKQVDGVVAVVGDFIILNSDIDKAYLDLKNQGVSTSEVSRCELMGSLLESKLYNHHAIQDSIPVSDKQILQQVDQQIDYMKNQIGDEEKILKFYRKDNITDFKKELFDLGKSQRLSTAMQEKVITEVTITPDEVKQFFDKIPVDERPIINTEVEISQIVIKPKPADKEIQRVIERLDGFRTDVLENGSSFATKAVLYSQDPGSRSNGGKYTISRKDPFAKEFKEAAFSLQEGEVSKPFKTDFGYHIVTVDKIKGQQIDVRHILLVPEVASAELKKFKAHADSIRSEIVSGKISFSEAAKLYSDEKETKSDGGILMNPVTTDKRFELTKIDPILYGQVSNLEEGEVSGIIPEEERTGGKFFKIMTVAKKYDEHTADYANDYIKIKDLALNKKQLEAVDKWQKDKIIDTYIKINDPYQECDYSSNWVKK